MRTKNSFINIAVSCTSYLVIMIGSFVTRQIFATTLGLEIVGIECAFLNIISALSIVELGLGVSIVYKLYKPIVEKDWEQISVVLCFLKKCYVVISLTILALGFISMYFAISPINSTIPKIRLYEIFVLYIADAVASYFYYYKRTMFIADQKSYVNNIAHVIAQIAMFAFQIIVLKITLSFELYIICRIISKLIENFIISYNFDRKYQNINLKTKSRLPDIEKKDFFKNMKALFLHKFSSLGTTVSSGLIITYLISLTENGIYGNYTLIVTAIFMTTNEIFSGISSSFGNYFSTNSLDKVFKKYNTIYFLNFLIYSFAATSFLCLATPFINLWTGVGSAFNLSITISIAAYLYIFGMRQSIGMAKVSAGIYDQDKYLVMIGLIITFVSSWILARPFGILGIMLGNIIGVMTTSYWGQPYIVYRDVFNQKVKSYHYRFALYFVLTTIYCASAYFICDMLSEKISIVNSIAYLVSSYIGVSEVVAVLISKIIVNFSICLLFPNILNVVIFCKTEEFKDLYGSAKSFLVRKKK